MIGRVLRQPHARLTQKPSLDECYVYTFDQDVMEAVAGVKQGLEEEGMGDVANQVKASEANKTRRSGKQRKPYCVESVFVTYLKYSCLGFYIVMLATKTATAYSIMNGMCLVDLDWESLSYLNAENFQLVDDKVKTHDCPYRLQNVKG